MLGLGFRNKIVDGGIMLKVVAIQFLGDMVAYQRTRQSSSLQHFRTTALRWMDCALCAT